ncbi:hypothetical protein AB4Y40_16195 [Paraburkholderia sp. EG287B]|uniref:hypothetical protein n=1 Tax=Paraburkholderia sp. EG287B TaxID=3237010 RepID=UPI0034D24F28
MSADERACTAWLDTDTLDRCDSLARALRIDRRECLGKLIEAGLRAVVDGQLPLAAPKAVRYAEPVPQVPDVRPAPPVVRLQITHTRRIP